MPTNWRMRDAVGYLKLGTELVCLAVGLRVRVAVQNARDVAESPVDQVQANVDNGRIPPDLAAAWLELAARKASTHQGYEDAQPVD